MNNYLLVTSLKLIVLNPYNYALNGNQCKNNKSFFISKLFLRKMI